MAFGRCAFTCIILYTILLVLGQSDFLNGTAYFIDNEFTIKLGIMDCDAGIACGYFNDSLNITGWSTLEIQTNNQSEQITDFQRMYAAGYLEGFLSSKEIYYSYLTQWQGMKQDFAPFQLQLDEWTQQQRTWMEQQFAANPDDAYWQYVHGLTAQFDGLRQGYNDAVHSLHNDELPALNESQFQFIVGNADLGDVIGAILVNKTAENGNTANKRLSKLQRTYSMTHCSGLVHVTPELDNIYFSHATWWSYYCTNRVWKHYMLALRASYATTHLSMSSFPGCLSSTDDFYQMDSGLASMETTNTLYNVKLLSLVTPQSLFTWQRARIANAMATNAQQWIELFAKYNSGTYNSQWLVLDFNRFVPQQPLVDATLMIAEQIPGNVSQMDVTRQLVNGYFASYNIPAIPYIYEMSGAKTYAEMHGADNSYDLAPRARIFRRDANSANNMSAVQRLMRYNDYLHDGIQERNPMWAVMSRADLLSGEDADCFGGIDTKITDYRMMQNMQSLAINGPTNGNVPTFAWTNEWSDNDKCPHTALPVVYDFPWTSMQSTLK